MVETIEFISEKKDGKTFGQVQSGVTAAGREAAYLNKRMQSDTLPATRAMRR